MCLWGTLFVYFFTHTQSAWSVHLGRFSHNSTLGMVSSLVCGHPKNSLGDIFALFLVLARGVETLLLLFSEIASGLLLSILA